MLYKTASENQWEHTKWKMSQIRLVINKNVGAVETFITCLSKLHLFLLLFFQQGKDI